MLGHNNLLSEHGGLVGNIEAEAVHVLICEYGLTNWLLLLLAECPSGLIHVARWFSVLPTIVVQDLKQASRAIRVPIMDRGD